MRENFYTYIYLDPRKPGKYSYNIDMSFLYEPFYVGKGSGYRMNNHLNKVENGSKLIFNKFKCAKINKILNEGMKPIIIIYKENLKENEAFNIEKVLIKKIGRKDLKKGPITNFTNGGEGSSGRKLSEETKEKIRQKAVGRKHSKKSKEKMSKSRSGDGNPKYGKKGEDSHWFGRKHSKKSKEKMRKNKPDGFGLHLLGKPMYEQIKKKIGEANIGKRAKPINIYNENGKLLKECRTTTDASKFSGLKSSEMKSLIKSGLVSKKGYIFKYSN